jgi:MFS family permease
MIYPLLPVFLVQTLGASQVFVGLVEGIAESTASFFTLFSGKISDRTPDRSRLIFFGYSLSSFSKPLIAIAQNPATVLFVRFFDRVGKGIRTSPRDALIADSVQSGYRGAAYRLHRTMDHTGAVLGPLIASVLLATVVTEMRVIFWLATIPAFLSVFLILWKVREVLPKDRVFSSAKGFRLPAPDARLRSYLVILFIFILSCSSDAFLLLRAKELGVSVVMLPLIWMVFNLVKALTTLPGGLLADKIGRRRVILLGWMIYILVYLGFALAKTPDHAWVLFACYGLFYGLTEGSERAFLADLAPHHDKGLTFGWFYLITGLGAFPASIFFGWIWQTRGSQTAFLISAAISSVAAFLMLVFIRRYPSIKGASV